MFCPHCGTKMPDEAAFCGACGKAIVKPKPAAPPQPAAPAEPPKPAIPVRPVAPAAPPKPVTPKEPKPKRKPLIKKDTLVNIGMMLLLAVLYSGLCACFMLFLYAENMIHVQSVYDSEVIGKMSVQQLLGFMVVGNRILHPTMLSVALGIGAYILIFAVPVFAVLALLGAILNKRVTALHVSSWIISCLAAAILVAIPVVVSLVSQLKQAVAIEANLVVGDVKTVSFISAAVLLLVTVILMTVISIVTAKLKRRRTAA